MLTHGSLRASQGVMRVSGRVVGVVWQHAKPSLCRLQSTSTMALVTQQSTVCNSTLDYAEKKDFSTAVASDDNYSEQHWEALLSAASQQTTQRSTPMARGRELDLIEAAASVELYDKMLLLVRHGDIKEQSDKEEQLLLDPLLSGKGVGQVLNMSRRTSTFCNEETGLAPELVVTSPLKRAVQTALLAFPQYTPATSLKKIPWMCHGGLEEQPHDSQDVPSSRTELESMFPGIDFGLYDQYANQETTDTGMVESKLDLLGRTDAFLEWIKGRDERVIVVSSHSTWLQSFCGCTLQYEPEASGHDLFKTGEMRAVGVKFTS